MEQIDRALNYLYKIYKNGPLNKYDIRCAAGHPYRDGGKLAIPETLKDALKKKLEERQHRLVDYAYRRRLTNEFIRNERDKINLLIARR